VLLLGNQSLARGPSSRIDIEDDLIVDHASVVDFEADGTTEIDRFTNDVSAFVLPPAVGSLGLGTLNLELVSSHALQTVVGSRVLASVHLEGRLADGTRTASGPFVFPIDVCSGCLLSCPSTGACVVGQDQAICTSK
jgi:hypothetical protein